MDKASGKTKTHFPQGIKHKNYSDTYHYIKTQKLLKTS